MQHFETFTFEPQHHGQPPAETWTATVKMNGEPIGTVEAETPRQLSGTDKKPPLFAPCPDPYTRIF